MSVIRIDGAPPECLKKAKNLIDDIGNIEWFSVFFEDIPEEYSNVPNYYLSNGERIETKSTYLLILKCLDTDQEVWIEGATCGYSGSGPNCTKEILQLLGVRMDYNRISMEKIIRNEKVTLAHDLNFVIYQEDDHNSDLKQRLMKVMMKFKNPYNKMKAKEMFEMLGYIQPLRNVFGEEPEPYYFRVPYDTKQEYAKYTTNNRLTLHKRLENIDVNFLANLVQQIGFDLEADITTKIYEKTK